MISASSRLQLTAPAERLYGALTDVKRRDRTMALVLCGYALIWTLYGILAKGSQDIHFDMGEMVAWSRVLVLGTAKHPQVGAWIAWLWFEIFPERDWAFYLLAMTTATVALWIAWKLAQTYLDPGKCVLGLALLAFVPFYNFHALKYNANTIQLPFWALTTWLFLRSYDTRSLLYAALAGLAAAAAMQTKYWAIVLLVALVVAALADQRRAAYFRSAAPWITIACGAIGIAPHLVWLVENDLPPLAFSLQHTGQEQGLAAFLRYFPDALAYILAPIVLTALAARPNWPAIADSLWPPRGRRRTVAIAFGLPLILPATAFLAGVPVTALWAIPAMTLLPVVLTSSPAVSIPRAAVIRILMGAIAFPVVLTAAAPLIAYAIHTRDVAHDQARYALLAHQIDDLWHDVAGRPLKIVGSTTSLVNGVAFYLADKPVSFEMLAPRLTPWVDAGRIAREGAALVCRVDAPNCVATAERIAADQAGVRHVDVSLARTYFGRVGAAATYRIWAVPPAP